MPGLTLTEHIELPLQRALCFAGALAVIAVVELAVVQHIAREQIAREEISNTKARRFTGAAGRAEGRDEFLVRIEGITGHITTEAQIVPAGIGVLGNPVGDAPSTGTKAADQVVEGETGAGDDAIGWHEGLIQAAREGGVAADIERGIDTRRDVAGPGEFKGAVQKGIAGGQHHRRLCARAECREQERKRVQR